MLANINAVICVASLQHLTTFSGHAPAASPAPAAPPASVASRLRPPASVAPPTRLRGSAPAAPPPEFFLRWE
jgi:hypothetical protein